MNQRILLDTSAYAQFRRGRGSVVDVLATAERIFLSTITLGELEAGFVLGSRPDQNRGSLSDFLAEPFVEIVRIDETVAKRYGHLFAALRRAGTPVPVNDIWIGACAIHVGARVVTFDSDFDRFPDLDRLVLLLGPEPG